MLRSLARTSEFWVGLIAANLAYFVSVGVLSPGVADFVKIGAAYVVARLISKFVKAAIPAA